MVMKFPLKRWSRGCKGVLKLQVFSA
ncbi:unnamed protein product [Ectocarpus sp. CCAP 1310/34]|nr:unnamed protein product [Ectocarpus sp. CCAP 1310/34]